ncbi:MAG: ribosome-associated translation inhibitor RaiA [Candidatus Gracilibacteria bacterium]|jgi:putative sigma-54 modulation protein
MQVTIINKHLHLSDEQRAYIEEKVNHLKHYGEQVADESTQVRVDVETNSVKTTNKNISLQITMFVPHSVIRAEIFAVTIEEAVDLAVEKLKKQLERYKGKKNRRDQTGKWIPSSTLEQITSTQEGMAEVARISKRKVYDDLKPMHEEEAIEQMELLGHDFYAFMNVDTSKFSVVYRREDTSYGLLELGNK